MKFRRITVWRTPEGTVELRAGKTHITMSAEEARALAARLLVMADEEAGVVAMCAEEGVEVWKRGVSVARKLGLL